MTVKTKLTIQEGGFYINGKIVNENNSLSEGRLIGFLFNLFLPSSLKGEKIPDEISGEKACGKLIESVPLYFESGVNLLCFGLQGMNPFQNHYSRSSKAESDRKEFLSLISSSYFPDGSLNYRYLKTVESIIEKADEHGIAVLLTLFTQYGEHIFEDDFALMNAFYNITEWLAEKNYGNLLVSVNDETRYHFKSSLLNTEKLFGLVGTLKKAVPELPVSAVVKNERDAEKARENKKILLECADFIPIYSTLNYTTVKMTEEIYSYRTLPEYRNNKIPVIIVKGDNLNDKHNTYGENNLIQALKNNASWCFYDTEGLISFPFDFSLDGNREKMNFFNTVENIKKERYTLQ